MRGTHVLLLVMLGFLLLYFTVGKVNVSASGTGIGILVDGPPEALVNQTISYNITVINLGTYWDRNLTVTDKFPNGTSLSWNISDLAPISQTGYQHTISRILFTIKPNNVVSQPPPKHIDNNATVTGYACVTVSNVTVLDHVEAETSFPTVIGLPVGGYSVRLEPECLQMLSIYITLVFAIIAAMGYLSFKFKQTK